MKSCDGTTCSTCTLVGAYYIAMPPITLRTHAPLHYIPIPPMTLHAHVPYDITCPCPMTLLAHPPMILMPMPR